MRAASEGAVRQQGGKAAQPWEGIVMRRSAYMCLPAVVACLSLAVAPPAFAVSGAGPPSWVITSVAGPANFKPASVGDEYLVTATNVGGESTSGPVSITGAIHGEAEATTGLDYP